MVSEHPRDPGGGEPAGGREAVGDRHQGPGVAGSQVGGVHLEAGVAVQGNKFRFGFKKNLVCGETYCAEFSPMARHSARAADVWSQPETDSQSRPTPVPRAPIEFIIFLGKKNRKVSFVGNLKSIIPTHLDAAVDTSPVLFLMLSDRRPKGAELSHITRKGRPLSKPFWKKHVSPQRQFEHSNFPPPPP